jgi:hypothetical protein
MENKKLTDEDWDLILESLGYTKKRFEEYDKYPTYDFKQEQIERVTQLISKIKSIKR